MNQNILSIDIGNSRIKCASLNQHSHPVFLSLEQAIDNVEKSGDSWIIFYQSVTHHKKNKKVLSAFSSQNHKIINCQDYFSHFEMKNHYQQVDHISQLGIDRRAAALGAIYYHQHSNCIIIDAGTFTTIDLIVDKEFIGGYILPGLSLYESTYNSSHALKSLLEQNSLRVVDTAQLSQVPNESFYAMKSTYFYLLRGIIENMARLIKANPLPILTSGGAFPQIQQGLQVLVGDCYEILTDSALSHRICLHYHDYQQNQN